MEIQAVIKQAELQTVLKNHIEALTGKHVHGDVKLYTSGGMPMPGSTQNFEASCVISDEPAPAPVTQVVPAGTLYMSA